MLSVDSEFFFTRSEVASHSLDERELFNGWHERVSPLSCILFLKAAVWQMWCCFLNFSEFYEAVFGGATA